MPIPSQTTALLILALLFAPACWTESNSARFTLDGNSNTDPQCFEHAYPLEPKISAARDSDNTISLVFQSDSTNFNYTNGVFIEIYRPDMVRNDLSLPITFSPPETIDARVGAKITLFGACPDILNSFYLDGEIHFSALESGKNAHIAGTITNARIRNTRTHEVVAEGFSGYWDFKSRPRQLVQPFYGLP